MPANNFQGFTCVPEVSLLDPNEVVRTSADEKISFKSWRKQKNPGKPQIIEQNHHLPSKVPEPSAFNPPLSIPTTGIIPSNHKCCEDRVQEVTTIIEQQQVEINHLRNENSSLKRDFDELKSSFLALSQKVNELMVVEKHSPSRRKPQEQETDPFNVRPPSIATGGRWSLPGDYSECRDSAEGSTDRVLSDSNAGRAPPDKSQMMNNLFKKYFPKGGEAENFSPSNVPFMEYREEEKSMATVNYLTKYKLMGNNERVLDISKLKRQSKLF